MSYRGAPQSNKGHATVYTDGACSNNGYPNAKAGIGVWFGDNDPRNVSEPLSGRATNNRAEIQAATRAINQAADSGHKSVTVCSDSDFLIKSATQYIPNWQRNDWQLSNNAGPVKNKADFVELTKATDRMQGQVQWQKVPGHAGVKGNEEADRLATSGMNSRRYY